MAHFPMFVDINKKKILMVGGGNIALHKIGVLKDFGPEITVVSTEISDKILEMASGKITFENPNFKITCHQRTVKEEEVESYDMVISATDNSELNHEVSVWCQKRRIPVNAVDQPEDCSFIFPSYVREGNVVAAFSSGGKSPVITQYLKAQTKEYLTEFVGELAEYLGSIRDEVKEEYATMEERKQCYKKILEASLDKGEIVPFEELKCK